MPLRKKESSVLELANCFRKIGREKFQYKGNIIQKINDDPQYLKDNPNRRKPDISKARAILNYDPKIDIAMGVKKYLDFLFFE